MTNRKTIFSACALCHHSCGIEVTVESGRVTSVQGQQSHPLNRGKLCPKGRAAAEQLYHPDRLRYPLKKVHGSFERVSWDEALGEIADKWQRMADRYGPAALGIICGSAASANHELLALSRRFQGAVGTPNLFSMDDVCFRMRMLARELTFGSHLPEEMDSPLYLLWGHNPSASNFPLAMSIAANLKKGARVVVIDPRRIPLADKAELYLAIRPGTDGALALALINVMVREELYDAAFVARWTVGFDRLAAHVTRYTPEWAEGVTSVPADEIRRLARLFAGARGAIFQGSSTQDQAANGLQTNRAFAILQALTGAINRPGGWVAGPALQLSDLALPLPGVTGPAPWPKRGAPLSEQIPKELRGFIVAGGNPLLTLPDSNALREAFGRLELLVVYDQYLTKTAQQAHYVLPATHSLEGWGIGSNYQLCHGIPYLMLREPAVEPAGECRSALDFYRGLARQLGQGALFPWESDRELVAHLVAPSGLDFATLLQSRGGGLYREKRYGVEAPFPTRSGKIELYSHALEEAGLDPLPTYHEPTKSPRGPRWDDLGRQYPLVLSTGARSLYLSGSRLHHVKSLKRFEPSARAEIGVATAAAFGIGHLDEVIVETDRGWVKMKAEVSDRTMEGVVLVPHGWGGEANCNRLTDANCREPVLGYPQWKGLLCSIRKVKHGAVREVWIPPAR